MGWNERLEERGHRDCQHPTTHTHSFSWEYAEPVRCVKPSSECKTAAGLGLGTEHEGWERWATTGVRDLSRCGKLSSGKQQLQYQFWFASLSLQTALNRTSTCDLLVSQRLCWNLHEDVGVFVVSDCHNKTPQTGWFKQQKLIFSQSCRLKVQELDANRVGGGWDLWLADS